MLTQIKQQYRIRILRAILNLIARFEDYTFSDI